MANEAVEARREMTWREESVGGEQGSKAFYVSGEDLLHEWEREENRIQSEGWLGEP